MCVVPFSNFDSWSTFGPLWIRRLFYIFNCIAHFRPHLRSCYYFASLKTKCYFVSSSLTSKQKVGFLTVFLHSHKGWTAVPVRSLLSTTPIRVARPTFCQGAKSSPEKRQILRQGTKKGQPFYPNLSALTKSYEPILSNLWNGSVPQSQL